MFNRTFEIYDNLNKLQENFINKIFLSAETTPIQKISNKFLNAILQYDYDVCQIAFGDLGGRLYEVVNEIDLDHPEVLTGQFLSSFNKENENIEKSIQYLKLCSLSKEHNLNEISELLSKCIAKTLIPNIKSAVDFIKNQQHFVRLFKNAEERERLRNIKEVKTIELTSDFSKLENLWQLNPLIETYARYDNCYSEQIDLLRKKIGVYNQLGLTDMSNEMSVSLKDFESMIDNYHGFQRIPMTTVAILLAKMHKGILKSENTSQSKIFIDSSVFEGYNFDQIENEYVFVQHDGANVGLPKKRPDFNYKPSAYPLHTLETPDRVKDVIKYLDAFPDANGKPIFDHYIVIVPGITFPKFSYFQDTKGELKYYDNQFCAKKAFDSTLIKERFVVPAVVGEKDGKCYFICLFS